MPLQRSCAVASAAPDPDALYRFPAAGRNEAALRIHVESGPQGLCVWLGMTGDAASIARRSGAVLAQLRSDVHAAPLRLARVVCNGRTLYAAGATPVLSPSPEEFP